MCKISGSPRPQVTWLHNGKPVKEGKKFKVIEEEETYTLKITKAKKDMSGKYTVRARNKRGVKENSADLAVNLLGMGNVVYVHMCAMKPGICKSHLMTYYQWNQNNMCHLKSFKEVWPCMV